MYSITYKISQPADRAFSILVSLGLLLVGSLATNDAALAGSKAGPVRPSARCMLSIGHLATGALAEDEGPVAGALSTPPVRRLSECFGNPLPKDGVARYIDGRAEVKVHGPRDMLVWGPRWFASSRESPFGQNCLLRDVSH